MTTYVIHYSDPLRDSFQIVPGGFNGPGGAAAASSLRLYGRGALEWGESVDENMLRLVENFNGATPPPFPVGGQLWYNTKFYWLETGVTWWRLDPNVPGTWVNIGPTGTAEVNGGVVGTNTTPPEVTGTYWYTGGTPGGTDAFGEPIKPLTLYLFEQYGPPGVAAGWLERTNSVDVVPPVNGTDYPVRSLMVWDEFGGTAGVWTAAADLVALGGVLADGSVAMTGDLDMGTVNNIINLADPVNPQDAMTLNYADTNYLRLNTTNDPLTADLTLFTNGAYPQANSDIAATITYVNAAAAAVTGGSAAIWSGGGAVSHKPGDIYINTGTARIWIAVTTASSAPTNYAGDGSDANWKQVFPALYS